MSAESATASFRTESSVAEDESWMVVDSAELSNTVPWRTFRWYEGQRHYSGTYWSATMRDHVVYESRLELARLIFADFDRAVHRILAQPFLLKAKVDGKISKHIPDYFLVGSIAPLHGAAASLTRNAITSAIASGAPACAITSAGNVARLAGVSSSCGATALTRIPCGRSSISRMRVKWTRAALLTAYAAMPPGGSIPGRAATCTMAPEPYCRICGATAWLSHSAGPRLTSIMSCSVSGVVVSASPGRNAPMVFTSTSGGPTSPAIRSTRLFAAAGSVASATSGRTLPEKSPNPRSLRSTATTVRPAAARVTAVA
jgi:hypothetical protein